MVKKTTEKEQYEKDIKRTSEDFGNIAESTAELIDLPFFEFCQFLEKRNVGELLAFRSLLQVNLDRVDVYTKSLVEMDKVGGFSKEDRIKVGSLFAVAAKIQDRMGYIDYLYKKNSVK